MVEFLGPWEFHGPNFLGAKREAVVIRPDFSTFREIATRAKVIPVYAEILADTETPVRALMRFAQRPYVFLLESVEGGERWGRYSFLGFDPPTVWEVRGEEVWIKEGSGTLRTPHRGDPFGDLGRLLKPGCGARIDGLPRFWGGAVGYIGYDMVRFMERVPSFQKPSLTIPDACMMLTDCLLIFDNLRHTVMIVATARLEEGGTGLRDTYEEAAKKVRAILQRLREPVSHPPNCCTPLANAAFPPPSNMDKEEFLKAVHRVKEEILAGEAIQVVLSQRFEIEVDCDPVALYRALRFVNPSPYLFFLKHRDLILVGSSPEVMVRLEDGVLDLRPIAGTRRRGLTEKEDRELAHELLTDPKERAEHVMLVDLGRNDLGRVARTGSVQVREFMTVERYSHVMHLVSHIQAQLAEGKDAFDVLKATFPAGTLTGAPKVRAMEIIEELEPTRRGPYGGAVGYMSYTGNMDLAITIRTLIVHQGKVYLQTGAGIVADSDPTAEYEETCAKARGMWEALRMATSGLAIKDDPKDGSKKHSETRVPC